MSSFSLFFSSEAQSPTGQYLVNIYYPVYSRFNEIYASKYADCELDNITIVFICTDEEMQADGFYKERNYISWKNKFADMRLYVPYSEFRKGGYKERKRMMWNVILRALDNIRRKKAFSRIDELEKDLYKIYWHGEA